MVMRELRLLSSTGILGYGYNEESFRHGLAKNPSLIACDGGSTDPGPYALGSGETKEGMRSVKRDLTLMLLAARKINVPVIVGTCGNAGGEPHLQAVREVAEQIAAESGLRFKMALIHAEQSKDYILNKLREKKVTPLWPVGSLTEDAVKNSERIVGVMGVEPYIEALNNGAEVILAGRSDDAAIFAALPIREGFPEAISWLAGKYLECGTSCTTPRHKFGIDSVFATMHEDDIILEPLHPGIACTPLSTSQFLLHENETPKYHIEPSGVLDTCDLQAESVSDIATRVWGARWKPAEKYTIKIEGAELVGYRTICIGLIRDPILIASLDDFLARSLETAKVRIEALGIKADEYKIVLKVIGRDAVLGPREPAKRIAGHEIGLLVEAVGKTQEEADVALSKIRSIIKNGFFEGKKCDEGCIAFPHSPADIPMGPLYRFHIWHVVEPSAPLEMFPIEYINVGSA
jgi:hypothetical protein